MTTTATFRQFRGNPYIACTAITMGTIASSRTSCTGVPAFFHLSASAVTATGTGDGTGDINPYEDIEYSWEVTAGDESGDHDITCSWLIPLIAGTPQSAARDSHTDQVGPEAVFRFFLPGTKTVTLTARAADGAGGYITNTATIDLTVTAHGITAHYWYDPDSGNNANDGRDPWGFAISGATFTNSTKRLVKAGAFASYDHAAATAPDEVSRYNYIYITSGTGVTAGLYEIAAKISDDEIELAADIGGTNPTNVASSTGPRASTASSNLTSSMVQHFKAGNTASHTIPTTGGLRNKTDCVFVRYGTGYAALTGGAFVQYSTTGTGQQSVRHTWHGWSIDRADAASSQCFQATTSGSESPIDGFYLSDCDLSDCLYNAVSITNLSTDLPENGSGLWNCTISQPSASSSRNGVFVGSIGDWWSVIGGSISGNGDSATLDHHIYPDVRNHSIHKWINFGAGTNRNYCINTSCNLPTADDRADYHVVSECNISSVLRGVDISDGGGSEVGFFRNFVIEANAVNGLTGNGHFLYYQCKSVTFRDNLFWDNSGGQTIWPETTESADQVLKIYKNRFWTDMASTEAVVELGSLLENVLFRDNDFHDDRSSTSYTFDIDFDGSGMIAIGNRIHTPNRTGNVLKNDTVATTYAAYAAVDTLARDNDPEWTDASTGDFTPTYDFGPVTDVVIGYVSNDGSVLGWTPDNASENLWAFARIGTAAGTYTSQQGDLTYPRFFDVPSSLSGLAASTTHYFRIYATDGYDISAGATEQSFTTQAIVPVDDDPLFALDGVNVNPAARLVWTNPGNMDGDQAVVAATVALDSGDPISANLCGRIAPYSITGTVVAWRMDIVCQAAEGVGAYENGYWITPELYAADGTALLTGVGTVVPPDSSGATSVYLSLASGVTNQDVIDAIAAGIDNASPTLPYGISLVAFGDNTGTVTISVYNASLVAILQGEAGGGFSSNKKVAASMLLLPSRRR